MSNDLQTYLDEWIDPNEHLPAEHLLDDDHPAADDFHQAVTDLERSIFAHGRSMKHKHREFARMVRTAASTKDISKKFNKTAHTVYTWAKRPDVQRMIALLDRLQHKMDGPTLAHRNGILYRIALDNEEKRPNVSVQALQEINKVSGAYAQEGNFGNSGNVVQIQINGEILPRGALDVMPETYESRVASGEIKVIIPDGS